MVRLKKLLFIVCCLSLTFPGYAAKGFCGESVYWSLISDTLMIAGKGAMYDYYSGTEVPYSPYKDNIRNLVISEGVTDVGSYCFAGLDSLRTISLPVSLVSLGKSAFESCISIGEVTIDNNIKKMYPYVFRNCSGLKIVNWNAADCEMVLVKSESDYEYYPNYSFRGTGVECVNFGENIKIIPEEIFSSVKSLATVNIAGDIESVRYGAFNGTAWLDSQPSGMVYVGRCAYIFKPYPEGKEPEPLVIREGTLTLSYGAFQNGGWESISEIVFPRSLQSVSCWIFSKDEISPSKVVWNCESVRPELLIRKHSFDPYPINPPFNGIVTDFVFGDSVRNLLPRMLQNVTLTGGLTLPESLERVPDYMFSNIKNIDSISLPKNLKQIGMYAFANSSIKTLAIQSLTEACNNDDGLNQHVFRNADSIRHLIVGNAVKAWIPFSYISNLRQMDWNAVESDPYPEEEWMRWVYHKGPLKVNIGPDVKKLPDNFFKDAPLNRVELEVHTSDNGVLEEIGKCAFQNASCLKSIDLPPSLRRINAKAFENTTSLTRIDLPDGLEEIDDRAFYHSAIENLFIPYSVRSLHAYGFNQCPLDTVIAAPPTSPRERVYLGFYNIPLLKPTVYVPDTESYGNWRPDVRPMVAGKDGDIYYSDGVTPPKLTLRSLIPGYSLECDFDSPYCTPGNYTVSVPVKFIGSRNFETEVSYSYEIKDTALSIEETEMSPLNVESIDGGIRISGSASMVSVYDLCGVCLYNGGDATLSLQKGIYIVRCGSIILKVEAR